VRRTNPTLISNWRNLAPAGGFSSLSDIFTVWNKLRQITKTEELNLSTTAQKLFRQKLNITQMSFTASGKDALFRVFAKAREQGKTSILVSAYTCPDIAVAAVKADLKIYQLDIDSNSLEPNPNTIGISISESVLVLSNLYGLIDALEPWRQTDSNLLIIDDGCQATLSKDDNCNVGVRPGTIGIFSFGRGKAFCGVGGGAIVNFSDTECPPSIINLSKEIIDLSKSVIFSLFENPYLYRFPSVVPFLHLGETKCEIEFSSEQMSTIQKIVAVAQLYEADSRTCIFHKNSELWCDQLKDLELILPVKVRARPELQISPIRFPVIFPSSKIRDKAYRQLRRCGLGASCSYPHILSDFMELKSHCINLDAPRAKDIATRIMTLPVHGYLQASDVTKTRDIIASQF
jgi:dTDP-4-amino-4,6-dideoxygalactose transaminase